MRTTGALLMIAGVILCTRDGVDLMAAGQLIAMGAVISFLPDMNGGKKQDDRVPHDLGRVSRPDPSPTDD